MSKKVTTIYGNTYPRFKTIPKTCWLSRCANDESGYLPHAMQTERLAWKLLVLKRSIAASDPQIYPRRIINNL